MSNENKKLFWKEVKKERGGVRGVNLRIMRKDGVNVRRGERSMEKSL